MHARFPALVATSGGDAFIHLHLHLLKLRLDQTIVELIKLLEAALDTATPLFMSVKVCALGLVMREVNARWYGEEPMRFAASTMRVTTCTYQVITILDGDVMKVGLTILVDVLHLF